MFIAVARAGRLDGSRRDRQASGMELPAWLAELAARDDPPAVIERERLIRFELLLGNSLASTHLSHRATSRANPAYL